jgi:hypothetical protein
MKLEDQVVSLELAKRLKELGVKQKSCFHWVDLNFDGKRGPLKPYPMHYGSEQPEKHDLHTPIASAFTVAELGEMLQSGMEDSHKTGFGHWTCAYLPSITGDGSDEVVRTSGDTEANARAKMLVYLLENKLITV